MIVATEHHANLFLDALNDAYADDLERTQIECVQIALQAVLDAVAPALEVQQ